MKTPDNGRPQNPEHLIGGYATGSLSPAEQQALLETALRDQALFDELMKEQALRDMLDEPGVRRELIASLGETNPSFIQRLKSWMRSPIGWSAAGALAAATVLSVAVWRADKPVPAVVQTSHQVEMRQDTVAPPAETEAKPRVLARKRATAPQPRPAPAAPAAEVPAMKSAPELPAPPALGELRDAAGSSAPPPPAPMATAPKREAAEAKAAAPALIYAILRGDAEGVFRPVASVGELRDGDRFKLTITPTQPGPLQVIRRGRDGVESAIFAANLPAGSTVIVPAGNALQMGELAAVVLEFGRVATPLSQPRFGFRAPAGAAAPRQEARQAAEPQPVRIEIKLRD